MINKEKVKTILCGLAEIADRPKDKKGNLDVRAFNELPEVSKAVKKLKGLKVTKKWLWSNGFMIAGMVLKI